jgi:hypothetical protein
MLLSALHGGQSRKLTASKCTLSRAPHNSKDKKFGPRPSEACTTSPSTGDSLYMQKSKGQPLLPPERQSTSASGKTQRRAQKSSNSSTGNYTMANLPKDTDTPRRTSVPCATARTHAHTLQENAKPTKTSQSAATTRHASSYTRRYATPQRGEAHYKAQTTYVWWRRTHAF